MASARQVNIAIIGKLHLQDISLFFLPSQANTILTQALAG